MAKLLVLVAFALCVLVLSASALYNKPTQQGGPAYGGRPSLVIQGGPAYGGYTLTDGRSYSEEVEIIPGRPLRGTGHHRQIDGPDGFGVHVFKHYGQPSGIAYGTWGKGTWKH